jgi:hypothetical protein
MGSERRDEIVAGLRAALVRQTGAGPTADPAEDRFVAVNGRLDLVALADAVLAALGEAAPARNGPPGKSARGVYAGADEGMTPDELDASNDE